ncbi:MAG: gamma-glutamyl-gamma-aminobutyrate hydrolase family protein [Actinobacteria bacterium]|nr:MAG: gamma-glutamyl-gamma-aminobutyrate hydrolase family protein [Actinomycetota bacterium]
MGRPRIGIGTGLERARWSYWDQQAMLLPRSYIAAIQRAGGMAVMLPPDAALAEDPDEALELLDALVLAGGADIDPGAYGEEPHPETKGTVPERDAFEVALTRAAIERDLPVLGICRGMQLINVAQGGTLLQDLPEHYGHHEHRREPGTFEGADHDVRLEPGSLAARAAGEELHSTKSHHHQGIESLGRDLRITGWSVLDDLPEALEAPDRQFVLGVQWHPEADEKSRLIDALVREAAAARAR